MSAEPYDPLARLNLGKSVAEALLDQPCHSLGDLPRFSGAGIYVIYYRGDYPLYAPLARANGNRFTWPIYIGKAIPSGARRGTSSRSASPGQSLYGRLRQHRNSIAEVERAGGRLRLADFHARYLIVEDIWIPLGENLLIARFKPLWNGYLDGFGNHAPGAGRHEGERPLWDTLHPGRAGFLKLRPNALAVQSIEDGVSAFLAENPPPDSGHMDFSTGA